MRVLTIIIQFLGAAAATACLIMAYHNPADPGWIATATLYGLWLLLPFLLLAWASWIARTDRELKLYLWGGLALATAANVVYVKPLTAFASMQYGIWFVAVPFVHLLGIAFLFAFAVKRSSSMHEQPAQ